MDNKLPLPGGRLGSFLIKQNLPVPELNLTAITLLHEPTGARLLHLACDDPNNVGPRNHGFKDFNASMKASALAPVAT